MKRFYFAWFMALFLIVLNQPAHAAMGVDISVLNSMTPAERQKALSLLGTASMPTQIGRQNNSSNLNQVPVDAGDQLGNALVSETDTALKPKDTIIVFFLDGEQAKLWDKEKSTAILDRSKWETFTTHLRQRGASVFIPKQMQQLYQLDEQGVLHIPSLQSFPLAGLNVEDAAARLNVDPMLQDYQIRIKQLPVKPLGLDAIKPFGYEIFQHSARAQMDPEWNVPVPASYVLGPGDVVHVQLFGKENQEYYLEVSRDGNIAFPGVGSVPVAGISFKELKEDIKSRIKKQFIGVAANVSLGELRSIHVFVLGDVKNPGSYIVSGLSSITHALLKAGGISESGSLRNIELKRNGRAEKKLDLYELLLNGSTRNDARLEAGDVVYVPPIQHTVSVIGEVNRPAIYELKNGETVAELIRLAGGTTNTAYRKEARIERTESDTQRHVLNVDLDKDKENSIKVKNGDVVTIDSVGTRAGKIVYLSGPTHRAAAHEWKQGLRLTDILDSLEAIHAQADPEYILVKSIDKNNQISAQSSSLLQALKNPNSAANLELRPRDEIMVFKRDETRTLLLTEMISQLELQASQDQDARIVEINGRVHAPGKYPLEEGMRVSDLIRASGRLQEAAYPLEAELTRFIVKPGKPRQIDHHTVELDKALKGDDKEDLILQPHDFVQIKETPLWTEEELVIVRGEVRFPGRYPIKRGEKLSSLIKRAGGLTSFAYAEGAVFTREQLRIKEQERMDAFASNLEAELATLSLQRSGDPSEMQSAGVANSLLSRLKTTKAAGRMVINLENIVGGRFQPDEDILLRGGDLLVVPSMMQEVTVIGEVFHPTSHLFESGASAEDYIGASGGATRRADPESSYIIRANGSVISAKSGWFSFSPKVMPGDTVVVPLDAEKVSSLKLWTSVTQIFYQLGVAAAAWNTLGVFP